MEQKGLSLREGQYFTIATPVDYEATIKRSRFIASLRIVTERCEFDEFLKAMALKFPRATHHCWAYRFTGNPLIEHGSDAGEPMGTAGRPILGALKKYSLENAAAIVTRYYGGVKLGVPGLISAYRETTISAIEAAEIVIREPMEVIQFKCSYDIYNSIIEVIRKYEVDLNGMTSKFEEHVSGEIKIPMAIVKKVFKEFNKIKHLGNMLEYSCDTPSHPTYPVD
jgi:uncharacterized YigZ family protein